MNILEVQDLCKTYGKGEAAVQALRHATFSVRKGEFIAIIGESGSGKSTLLNVVGALDKATSGKVWIDGQDIFSMPEKKLTVFRRQHIGFIFQSFNLIPELLYLFSSVAVAVHTAVAQICIGLKAELLCLRRTVFYQLIIQFIQLVCNPLIKRIHLCSRLFPDFPILMV
mgnify:CR=1 FL=1